MFAGPEALRRIRVVLVRPRFGGNVGSAARVVANMGLGGLDLAGAEELSASEARMMAVSAQDVLAGASRFPDLQAALQGRPLALAVSRRPKSSRLRIFTPREAAGHLAREMGSSGGALVFGPEDCGLTSEEAGLCGGIVSIPSAPECPSLNLAQAVMVCAWELRMALPGEQLQVSGERPLEDRLREEVMAQIEAVLDRSGFFIRNPRGRVMVHLAEILHGGLRDDKDARVVRGIFRRLAWALAQPPEGGGEE